MPVLVKCTNTACGKTLRVKDELAGKRVKCPGCQSTLRVPPATTIPAGVPAAVPAPAASAAPAPASSAAGAALPLEDDPAPAPARRKGSRGRDRAEFPPALLIPRLVLKPRGGLFTTDLKIVNPDDKEIVGLARDRTKKLFGLFKVNLFGWTNAERWEVFADEEEPPLFTISITKERNFVSGQMKGIQCDLLQGENDDVISAYRFDLKGQVKQSWQLKLLDADENEIGRVSAESGKIMAGEVPRIILSAPDGRELGAIAYKGLADAVAMMKEARAKGKKFGMVSSVGEPGLEITIAPEAVGDPTLHRALIALAVLMEVTRIGKQQVGVRH